MCSCVQVFTQVMTQGGRQYQVVVLILVPSTLVILLEGGILVDPGGSGREYSGTGGKVPIPGGGSPTANMGAA